MPRIVIKKRLQSLHGKFPAKKEAATVINFTDRANNSCAAIALSVGCPVGLIQFGKRQTMCATKPAQL